jgi:hypothetical protein
MGREECIHPVMFGCLYLFSLAETRCCLVACRKTCCMKYYNFMIKIFILCKYTLNVLILDNYALNIFKTYYYYLIFTNYRLIPSLAD